MSWLLLYPDNVSPDRWVRDVPVPVTAVTTHVRGALILAGTGQVTGVILSHGWWQLDGLIRPADSWQEPPARARPEWTDPATRRTSRRPERLDRPRPHWRT